MSQEYDISQFPKVAPPSFTHLDDFVSVKQVQSDIDYEELLSESETPYYQSNLEQPRMSAKKVRLSYYIGDRGGGKTSAMEEDAELYFNEGLSCWWLWGSRSNENVFIGVNRNCRRKWKKKLQKIEDSIVLANSIADRKALYDMLNNLKSRLHCDCHKAYPINWLVPNYYDFKGVKEYNYNWSGKDEFDEAFENGWVTRPFVELSSDEKKALIQRKLAKPKHLVKTDLIRICPFTIPDSAKNKEIFEKEYLGYALEARKEHRWLIMNPLNFLKEQDKFSTIGYIMERSKVWVDRYFQPNTPESVAKLRGVSEPVPKEEWTKVELSWDKIHLVLAEIRTIAPPHKYSPEQKSNLSKRPIIDMIPEMRHFRIWLNGDLQSPEDLNDSVRPMADYVVVKRSSADLLGKEWTHFFTNIENMRKNRLISMSHGKFDDFKKAPPEIKSMIDKSLPSIPEIPKNKGYVVYRNGEFYLETFGSASFHHKKETETLQSVTGITWKIRDEIAKTLDQVPGNSLESATKSEKRLKNHDTNRVMTWCAREYIKTFSWDKVKDNLITILQNPDNPEKLVTTGIELMEPKVISNKIRKVKEFKDIMDFAKKHKEKPTDELIASLKL